ncbi:MAG: carboxypeptidase regulatory-like domain-containing protein [Acidobacteria bacterium]|nr:carboxypeptidase regulatory-like domain-containing protein [Acidobacteriota bacterium]
MANRIEFRQSAARRLPILAWVFSLALVALLAQAPGGNRLLGGPKGMVRSSKGEALEGIMVQLISQKSAIRTTVYSNEDGRYQFPMMESGAYTLRIARPLEFHPYVKESVQINGPAPLEDIVLERITDAELLPPFPEIAAQLSGAEWLLSLSGTGDEKKLLTVNCNWCHSYQQIFRSRHDEQGWSQIVSRMTHGAGSALINVNERGRLPQEDEARLVKWLAAVRGPESKDPPFVALSRPRGRSTRAIITEYELPRLELATHDVAGDSEGNLWYSPHRSSYIGRMDPRTGSVKEYRVPPVPGALPGTHWIFVDRNDIVWASENWAHNIVRFDPRKEEFSKIAWKVAEPLNSPMGGNYAIDPEGFIWKCRDGAVSKVDPKSGNAIKRYDLKRFRNTYGSAISWDGRYFGGGAWPQDGVVIVDSRTGEIFEVETSRNSGPARGEFDPQGNYWSGGRGGVLVEFETAKRRIREFPVPTPYGSLYTAKADKNGEVWAGELQAGRYVRFNPKTQQWTEYLLPEPYGHDRESWIDNSTSPVTVWYVDHDGWLVRIQPLD